MVDFNNFIDYWQTKKTFINIHKYANQLICILEFYTIRQCFSFNLIPSLLFYSE